MKSNILYSVIGLLAGFAIGFVFANSIDGRQSKELQTGQTSSRAVDDAQKKSANSATKEQTSNNSDKNALTEEEIRGAIARADERADDAALQRNFGLALYAYANQMQDPRYLTDAARFLKRAHEADPQDRNLLVSLGNVLFDMGQLSDPARFTEARTYYLKALELEPKDVNVRTDLGLTYYFERPPKPEQAIKEYRKSLAIDPKHEATLQNLAAALIATRSYEEAAKRIEELQGINPQNPSLANLRAQLAQSKIEARDKS